MSESYLLGKVSSVISMTRSDFRVNKFTFFQVCTFDVRLIFFQLIFFFLLYECICAVSCLDKSIFGYSLDNGILFITQQLQYYT